MPKALLDSAYIPTCSKELQAEHTFTIGRASPLTAPMHPRKRATCILLKTWIVSKAFGTWSRHEQTWHDMSHLLRCQCFHGPVSFTDLKSQCNVFMQAISR